MVKWKVFISTKNWEKKKILEIEADNEEEAIKRASKRLPSNFGIDYALKIIENVEYPIIEKATNP